MSSIKFSPLDVAALKGAEPSREAWEDLVAWCYKTSSDGVSRVHEVTSHYLAMRNERDALKADAARLDFLEAEVARQNALLLHNGAVDAKRFSGLAFRDGWRSLRKAIDQCRGVL